MAKKVSKPSSNVKVANKNRSKKTFAKRNASKSGSVGKRPQITKSKSNVPKRENKRVPKEQKPKKKRKFEEVDSSDNDDFGGDLDAETWESRPRYHFEDEIKKVTDEEEIDVDTIEKSENDDDGEEEQHESKGDGQEKEYPVAELLLLKKNKFLELKDKVGSLAMSILADTHRNILKLKPLVMLLDQREDNELFPSLFVRDQTLIAFSLLELFKDILPTYRVMEKTVEEMNSKTKLKRETRELREFETTLLRYYKIFVDRLGRMIDCLKRKPKSNFYNFVRSVKCREKLAIVGAKCLSDLLVSHPYFNLRDELVKAVVPLLSSRNDRIRNMIFDSISRLYREDKSGHVSLSAVKESSKLIKALKLDVEPLAIRSFLSLRIKEVKKKETEINMRKLRDKLDHLSKKDRKYNKKMLKLTAQMRETEATEDQKKKLEFHTQILSHIMFCYFRLLKDIIELDECDKRSTKMNQCLTPVLEGLSKFCNLININFYGDLIGLLYKLINCGKLDHHQLMYTVNTVFTILATEGYSVNVDPHRFYVQFYTCLPHLNSTNFGSEDDAGLMDDCLDKLFFKRRKQLSVARVFAFCKRLTAVAIQTSPPMAALILSAVRMLMRDHPKCEILLDSEHYASGSYLPELDDPDFCNGGASRLWELHILKQHSSPMVRLLALSILKGSQLKTELLKKSPLEVYYEVVSLENKKLEDFIQTKID